MVRLERAPLLVWTPCARNRFLSGETEDGVDVDVAVFFSFFLFYFIVFVPLHALRPSPSAGLDCSGVCFCVKVCV